MMDILLATVWRVLSLLFLMLIVWGLVEWVEKRKRPIPRELRNYLIAAGLGVALVPASCFAGLILYRRGSPVGGWNNYVVASAFGRWNLPLAVISLIFGMAGKGRGRWLLVLSAGCLVLVWAMAVIHWPASA